MDCVSHTKWGVDGLEMYCGKGGTFDAYHCQYSEYKIDERAVNTGIEEIIQDQMLWKTFDMPRPIIDEYIVRLDLL